MNDHADTLRGMIPQFKGWRAGREALEAAVTLLEQRPRSGTERHELDACVWRRDSTQKWVLEISGTINNCEFVARHTEPLTTAPEDVAGLPSLYAALEAGRSGEAEPVGYQRRIQIEDGRWMRWEFYEDHYCEGRPAKVGHFNAEYRPVYLAAAPQQPPPVGVTDGEHVFTCRRCPVAVQSRWLEPPCPECGDPTEIDSTMKAHQQPAPSCDGTCFRSPAGLCTKHAAEADGVEAAPGVSEDIYRDDWISPQELDARLETLAEEYEWRGDEGDHTPTERERLLLIDFAHGIMSDDVFLAMMKAHHDPNARGRPAPVSEPAASDWYVSPEGSVCIDWDDTPKRHLSLMCRKDGRVMFAGFIDGERHHGDAMGPDFMRVLQRFTSTGGAE